MTEEIKQTKRGGARAGAGRKPRKPKSADPPKSAEIADTEKPKNGRPFEYDAAVFTQICERIAEGGFLKLICAEEGMPSETTFRRWKNADDKLRLAYAHAREDRADLWADEIVMISDDGSRDYVQTEDGREVPDHEHIQRSKLRVDTRKWVMAKHAPKSYGEKAALELSGKDGAPLIPVINVTIGPAESEPSS